MSGPNRRRARGEPADGFTPLPTGVYDLYPGACRRQRWLSRTLIETFDRWGYEPVGTPAIELYDVFGRGLTARERRRCIRFIEPGSGALVTLRSDVTPQIARLASLRYGDALLAGETRRLCYTADVVRQPDGRRERAEFHQVGVEYLGDASAAADVELISMCCEALAAVGLRDFAIDLAHVDVATGVLGKAAVGASGRSALRRALERKDEAALALQLAGTDTPAEVSQALRELCWMHGDASMLARVDPHLRPLGAGPGLDALRELCELLSRCAPELASRVSIDLGEVRGFDYYSGVRVRVWAPGAPTPIARGGRYDHLLARYGVDSPATGIALDLDALGVALELAGARPPCERAQGSLVALAPGHESPDAWARATQAARAERARGRRAWVTSGLSRERAMAAAEADGAAILVYISAGAQGTMDTATFCHQGGVWRSAPDGSP
ncbi:MAG: ATP phosphoribosyltransferase regulatory subunit [Myxococcales bacterium]|nr:ATP phosphoribosyltransferase regulatory subunit [Myxococcales bacterium]